MPLYEYECEQDGTVIEVQRPMADADKPLHDPEGKGRSFKRKFSVFATHGAAPSAGASSGSHVHTGGCACGRPGGGCGRMG
ncbi:MAG: zinc ribbon domain-containing protein [Phycisphaerales bacterium]|nr:zinc ribbon domain-containing protein [Phycisphaerales bacterium]